MSTSNIRESTQNLLCFYIIQGSSEQSYPHTTSTFTNHSTTNSQSDNGGGGQNNNKSFGGYDLAPPLIPPLPSQPPQVNSYILTTANTRGTAYFEYQLERKQG